MSEQPQQPQAAEQQPLFGIEKVYLKDLSLELPNAPQVFFEQEAPQVLVALLRVHHAVSPAVAPVALAIVSPGNYLRSSDRARDGRRRRAASPW